MSAVVDPVRSFLELEKQLEREPEGSQGEIARGVYMMTPRPRAAHGGAQVNLGAALRLRFGWGEGVVAPEWLFVAEPEVRSEENLSRLVPDLAAWRRSTTGWPDLNETPVSLVPEWVAEVLVADDRALRPEREDGRLGGDGRRLHLARRRRPAAGRDVRERPRHDGRRLRPRGGRRARRRAVRRARPPGRPSLSRLTPGFRQPFFPWFATAAAFAATASASPR
ncbi:MAG: Uma2 family endonuclease [Thermoanaerobaculia bacterium]|nr:Uma2 family endonuclease [Thermoanaerobaculia bacterium]